LIDEWFGLQDDVVDFDHCDLVPAAEGEIGVVATRTEVQQGEDQQREKKECSASEQDPQQCPRTFTVAHTSLSLQEDRAVISFQ